MAELMEADEGRANGKPEKLANDLHEDFLTLKDVGEESDEDDAQEDNEKKALEPSYDATVDLPPWMEHHVDYQRTNHLVALHNEVVGFRKHMDPHDNELNERQKL